MAAIEVDGSHPVVIVGGYFIKTGGQICIGEETAGTPTVPDVTSGQIPACPIGLAEMIAVIDGFDRPLNEVMIMIVRVIRGIAGIAQLHLQGCIDDCPCRQGGEKQRRGAV